MQQNRYTKQTLLSEVGHNGQEKLQQSRVLVVGAGGLGCAILPYLASAGVGYIGIIDQDHIEISNLQRQVLYDTDAVGLLKVQEAKKKLSHLNPTITIQVIDSYLNQHNAINICKDYDIIVDATDNSKTRFLINDVCCLLNKPFVYGSVYKFEGQVAVFNYLGSATYRCAFNEDNLSGSNCNQSGVLGTTVGIIGMFQANEVLKMILGIGEVLTNKIQIFNALTNKSEAFTIARKQPPITLAQYHSLYFIENKKEITPIETVNKLNNKTAILIDVRDKNELPRLEGVNFLEIPLFDLTKNLSLLDLEKEIILVCQAGTRSAQAQEILIQKGFSNVSNLSAGASKLLDHIKSVNKQNVVL